MIVRLKLVVCPFCDGYNSVTQMSIPGRPKPRDPYESRDQARADPEPSKSQEEAEEEFKLKGKDVLSPEVGGKELFPIPIGGHYLHLSCLENDVDAVRKFLKKVPKSEYNMGTLFHSYSKAFSSEWIHSTHFGHREWQSGDRRTLGEGNQGAFCKFSIES